jgi:tetratricopeptide (TPR) repeat protein
MKPNNDNITSYKSTPHTLIPLAQEYINNKQYDTSISILETAISYAIDIYKHKTHINLAQYYSKYAEALIYKVMDSDDLFKQHSPMNNTNEQVIVRYLTLAEDIYNDYIINHNEECYYSELADVYKLYGEYQKAFSDFVKASEYYQKAINIRISKLYDTHSRILAEMYFHKASVLDFNAKECLLFYYKTLKILEYHLSLNVNGSVSGLNVNDDCDCELSEIDVCDEKIYVNRKVIEGISNDTLNDEGKELKDIICDIYFKIEDVILEIKEYDKFVEEKNKMKEKNNYNNVLGGKDCFTVNYDIKKVLDISASAMVRKKKKRKCDDNNNNNDSISEEDMLINEIQSKEKVIITKF